MAEYTVKAVSDALMLLTCFDYYHPTLGLPEFEARTGLPKSKTFRLLKTLEALNFVVQDVSGQYRLGTAALLLGRVSRYSDKVQAVITEMLQRLSDASQETINFATIQGRSLVYAAIVESPYAFRITEKLGDIASWEHTALGRAILAHHPHPRLFIPAERVRHLKPMLESVRRQQYAIDDEETERGVRCVGVCVRDGHGAIVGGCSISAPAVRMPIQRAHELGRQLIEEAHTVEVRLRDYMEQDTDPIMFSHDGH
jgi:DNA-binding IclR family transcriptional regulator